MDSVSNESRDSGSPQGTGVAAGPAGSRRWPRRLAAAISASALLGGGVALGVAMTGGASAAAGTAATRTGDAAGRSCARLAAELRHDGHPVAARRVTALCRFPLLRLAAVGGLHGEVTFKTRSGNKTVAFERGTVESASSSVITVEAADGTTWTWQLAGNTIVRQAGQRVAAGRLARGDKVFVGGPVVGGADDARLIRIR